MATDGNGNGNGNGGRRRAETTADFFQVTTLVDIPSDLDDSLRRLAHEDQKTKTDVIRELLVQGVASRNASETTSQ